MAENAVPATEVKNLETLQQELATKRADLLEAQRGHRAGELANPRILGVYRREIAQILTEINQRKGTN
ncbi:50S ribosomal protein L29 [Candidatus Saccharibacteria bacterium]|nr:50S ribosomal protein L29 [Candidatus Saccharibacteria bacterium]